MGDLKLFHVDDLLELTGLSRRTIYEYLKNGQLKGYKVANKWIFTKDQLLDFVEDKSIVLEGRFAKLLG